MFILLFDNINYIFYLLIVATECVDVLRAGFLPIYLYAFLVLVVALRSIIAELYAE